MILSRASLARSHGRVGAGLRQLAAALAVVAFASGTASAQFSTTYGFDGVSNNSTTDTAIAERQFQLTVSAESSTGTPTSFTFAKLGDEVASITDVYFYDSGGTLGSNFTTSNPTIIPSGSGVVFTKDANPDHLPGYSNVTAAYSAQSSNPASGVDLKNEFVTFTFASTNFNAITSALSSGTLVVGIKVQGFTSNGSETLTAVPEPASVAMLGMSSLVGLGYAWRKRKGAVA